MSELLKETEMTETMKFVSSMQDQLFTMEENLNGLERLKNRIISEPSPEGKASVKSDTNNDLMSKLKEINVWISNNNEKFNRILTALNKMI